MAYIDKYGVEFSDDRKRLVKCPEDFQGDYKIPEGVNYIGQNVNFGFILRIRSGAFSNCNNLKNIYIPNTVLSIGKDAFSGCSNISRLYLPHNLRYAALCMLNGCENLQDINFPQKTTYCFCKKCTHPIVLNNIINCKGYKLFEKCLIEANKEINGEFFVPNTIKSIGIGAFKQCEELTSVIIPEGVLEVGKNTFRDCKNLLFVKFPNSVISVGSLAFQNCDNLAQIIVPKGQKARFEQMEGLKDFKDKIVEASLEDQKLRTWEEVNSKYRAYFERRQKENPNIQNKNGGTPLEFPPFGIELSFQEYSQFKKDGHTIPFWMFWCKSGNEIHELARLYAPVNSIGLSTPRQGYYKIVGIEGEGNDTMLVCYYNLFSSDEFLEEEDEKVRVKQKPLFNKHSSCAGPIDVGDIIHVKSTELVEDTYNGRTYQAYKIIWEFV